MYLNGLGDCLPPSSWEASGDNVGVSITNCRSQGGSWVSTGFMAGRCQIPGKCSAPPPAPVTNTTISVPTSVTTQVSPAISPNLIQQQQPTNSPVGAGTQSSPSQGPDTSAALMAFMAQQKQMADAQAAAQKAQQDQMNEALLNLSNQRSAPAVAVQPQPQMQETVSYAPAPEAVEPAPVAPMVVAAPHKDYTAMIVLAALGAGFMLMKKRGR